MKKALIYISIVLIIGASACLKLEIDPKDQYSDNVLNSVEATNLVLNGAYARLTDYGYYGREFVYLSDLTSDDAEYVPGRTYFTERQELEVFAYGPGHPYIAMVYSNGFESIATCNRVLDNYSDEYDPKIKGQALFLRALNYFNFVRLFGGVPLLTTLNQPLENILEAKRATIDEVYDQIISDLTDIVDNNLLPYSWEQSEFGRATIHAAHTLLAKVYLTVASEGTEYTKDKSGFWTKASEHAKWVRDNSPHALEPDYMNLWNTLWRSGSNELIFFLATNGADRNEGGVPGRFYRNYEPIDPGFNDGWGNNIPDNSLYEKFDKDEYRREVGFLTWFIVKDGDTLTRRSNVTNVEKTFVPGDTVYYDFWTPDPIKRPHLRKYYYNPGAMSNYESNVDDINIPIFRYAEVLLMIAEADNEANAGPTADAYEAVNQVLRRAYKQDIYTPGVYDAEAGLDYKEFQNLVRRERYKELHMEAKRWFDLVRWDNYVEVMQALGKTNIGKHHKYYPIPQSARATNPNLTQNQGY